MIFASTPATGSAAHKGPGVYLAAGVGWGRTHEPNPILVAFRPIYTPDSARWYKNRPAGVPGVRNANWGHIDHARRVLTRLAALGEVSDV